jgi:hypothetical protein
MFTILASVLEGMEREEEEIRTWRSNELGRKHPGRDLPIGLPAPCASIRCFKRLILRSYPAPALRLSRAHAQRGTLIHLVRL